MPRRMELELTSQRPDGSWTWRAAGAREPRGEVDGSLLPSGSKVGDVFRAETEIDIEGISVLAILPAKDERGEPERLEIIGPQRTFTPVTSTLVGRADRGDRRPPRDRGDRPDRGDRRDRTERPTRPRREDGGDRPRRPRTETTPRAERPRRARPAPPPPKPKPKKLRPGHVHRDELIAALSPEQQPIAEQLFRGGMPSVRQALEEQNLRARTEGTPEIPSVTVLAIAEDLLPRVRVADWLDRAEAALAEAEEIALRDLRAVVTSADDVARDETTRVLASQLREVLERRSSAEQSEWLADLTSSIEGGRVVRALRLSSRPPHPGEALSDEQLAKLGEAASAAMTADIASDRWATLLDAVAYSPIRRTVVPAGAPAEPTEELLAMARKHAGRVPSAAKLFGIEPPPAPKRPPRPKAKPRPQKASHPPLPPLPSGQRRIPPPPRPSAPAPPPAPTAPAGEVPASPVADSPEPHGDVLPVDPAPEPVQAAVPTPEPAPPTLEIPDAHPDEASLGERHDPAPPDAAPPPAAD